MIDGEYKYYCYTSHNCGNIRQYDGITTYTLSHKKHATLFLIITPAFLGRFLYFLYQYKQEEILYNGLMTS